MMFIKGDMVFRVKHHSDMYLTKGKAYEVEEVLDNVYIQITSDNNRTLKTKAEYWKLAEQEEQMEEVQWKISGTSEKLYDRDKEGRLITASYTIYSGSDGTAKFVKEQQVHGLAKNKYESVCKPLKTKTALESAYTKVNHKLKLMARDGWVPDPKDVGQFVFKPMLISKYEDQKKNIIFPCVMQPKLDGVRCLYDRKNNVLVSRGGKIYNLPHITEELKGCSDYIDGELYVHGEELQDIVSMVKSGSEKVQFYAFDMPDSSGTTTYDTRLRRLVATFPEESKHCHLVSTTIARDFKALDELYELYVKEGFEGAVIKNLKSLYEWNERTKDVLKRKPLFTDEFVICGVTSDNLSSGGEGIKYICKQEDGIDFEVVPKGTHAHRKLKLKEYTDGTDNPINKKLTVEYRGRSKDNVPTHAVGISVRDYEEKE